jgi:hypothetical protein
MALTNLINRLKGVQTKAKVFDMNKAIADIINKNDVAITNILRKQIATGKDADNQVFELERGGSHYPFYSDFTVFEKEKKGQRTDIITYHDSGAFYISLYVYASGTTFIFDSDVNYFNSILLHAKSGERIIELNQENLALVRNEIIIPQLKIAIAESRA